MLKILGSSNPFARNCHRREVLNIGALSALGLTLPAMLQFESAAARETGSVNVVTGRGRHTSTSAVVLPLPDGGWIVDTPGIRSFGLAHVDAAQLIEAFPDLSDLSLDCSRGCTHEADEPECALDDHPELAERVASYRRLLGSRAVRDY